MRSFEIVRQTVPLLWFCFTASASPGTGLKQPFDGLASHWQSELVTLLQSACDPRCCGATTGNDRSLPCCASCDGIVSLDNIGIPFAVPAASEQTSERSNAAEAEEKDHVEAVSPQSPLAIITPGLGAPILVIPRGPSLPFVIRCTFCKNGGLDCSDPKNCDGGGGAAIIAPHHPPAFFQDDDGNWQLLLQEETNALSIKKACICGEDQISMECPCANSKTSDAEALRKMIPKRDEL